MSLKSEFSKGLDPENVQALCEETRWSKNGLDLSSGYEFGDIPEQFDAIAESLPSDSDRHAEYKAAAEEARSIYRLQILSDVRRYSQGKDRGELENTVIQLRQVSDKFDDINKNIAGRIMWSGYMIGDWYMKNNPSRDNGNLVNGRTPSGIGYQQFRAK